MDQGRRNQVRNRGCTETAVVKVNAGGVMARKLSSQVGSNQSGNSKGADVESEILQLQR